MEFFEIKMADSFIATNKLNYISIEPKTNKCVSPRGVKMSFYSASGTCYDIPPAKSFTKANEGFKVNTAVKKVR